MQWGHNGVNGCQEQAPHMISHCWVSQYCSLSTSSVTSFKCIQYNWSLTTGHWEIYLQLYQVHFNCFNPSRRMPNSYWLMVFSINLEYKNRIRSHTFHVSRFPRVSQIMWKGSKLSISNKQIGGGALPHYYIYHNITCSWIRDITGIFGMEVEVKKKYLRISYIVGVF